jgi:hypothetical protein
MASKPPDTSNTSSSFSVRSGANMSIVSFAQKIWIPFWLMSAGFSALSASFIFGAPIKTFGMFGLCGFVLFGLFKNLSANNTILSKTNHWAVLALIAHTFYFNIFQAMVTK